MKRICIHGLRALGATGRSVSHEILPLFRILDPNRPTGRKLRGYLVGGERRVGGAQGNGDRLSTANSALHVIPPIPTINSHPTCTFSEQYLGREPGSVTHRSPPLPVVHSCQRALSLHTSRHGRHPCPSEAPVLFHTKPWNNFRVKYLIPAKIGPCQLKSRGKASLRLCENIVIHCSKTF